MATLPLIRQLLVALSPQLAAISVGGSVTYPTLLLQQLKSNDSSIQLDIHDGSWVGSIYGLAGIPVILVPAFMNWRGRKAALVMTCCSIAIGWILSYFATSTAMILLSECFHGFGTNSLLPVAVLAMTEMLDPKLRFLCMQLFSINQGVGMAIGGIAGQFLSFRTISCIMFIPVAAATMIALAWPDSPPWLACKGEFQKCEKAFTWLRGTSESSMKELVEMITAQKENLTAKKYDKMTWKGFWDQITRRDFYVPSLHVYLLLSLLYWSGGDVVLVYFIELVTKSTTNASASFYAAIIMYTIVLVGVIITTISTRYFNNKTVLLFSTSGVTISLIGICLTTYLQSIGVIAMDSLLCICCLIAYMVFNALGMNGVVFFIGAELMPIKHRNISGSLFVMYNCGLYATTLKISPYMIYYMGIWGTFLIFTCNIVICSYLVWRYVPETRERTLQEIEDYYTHGKFIQRIIDDELKNICNNTSK